MNHTLDINELRATAAFRKPGYVEECVKKAISVDAGIVLLSDEDYQEIGKRFALGKKTKRKEDIYDQSRWPSFARRLAEKRIPSDRGVGDIQVRMPIPGGSCGCTEPEEIEEIKRTREASRGKLNRNFPFKKVKKPTPRFYLTACAIVRDELDLPEWVAYQLAIGFEHVHFFDNESAVPVSDVLRNWIKDGKVSVDRVAGRRRQNDCYSQRLSDSKSKWVAFIDPDEFILPHETDDIRKLLSGFEKYGGFALTWKVFGSNGHVERPSGLVIENYLRTTEGFFDVKPRSGERLPQYKTIAQPEHAVRFPNPHWAAYRDGRYAVNERRQRMPCHSHGPASVKLAQLNHYIGRSLEDFRLKQERRGPMSNISRTDREWRHWEAHCNAVEDRRILRFVPAVKELMEKYK